MDETEDSSEGLLDPVLIGEIVRRLAATNIDELEVSDGSSRLYLRRDPGAVVAALPSGAASPSEPRRSGAAVTAPLTGVFYARPAPDHSAFVDVGAFIEVDDVVALIETMKLRGPKCSSEIFRVL